jgi:hypothetical protein
MTDEVAPLGLLDQQAETDQDWTLVWLDARRAVIVRWSNGDVSIERYESDVPRQHRSTGHVRHGDTGRTHAGPPRSAGDTHRLEHLRRYIENVRRRLPTGDRLAICGPGPVALQLARAIDDDDQHHGRSRLVMHRPAAAMTDRQMVAEVRRLAGNLPPRRTVGAYRWSGRQPVTSAGNARPPRRVVRKQASPPIDYDWEEDL